MSASSCALVSTTALNSVLHSVVEAPTAASSRYQTSCKYLIPRSKAALTIRYSMKISRDAFNSTVPQEVSSKGTLTRHVCSLGDSAYWGTVGTGSSATTVLAVLQGTNEIVIAGSLSPHQAKQIASAVLPSL